MKPHAKVIIIYLEPRRAKVKLHTFESDVYVNPIRKLAFWGCIK